MKNYSVIKTIIFLSFVMIFFSYTCFSKGTVKKASSKTGTGQIDQDAKMAWWHEAKFGMFIHWGLYAVPANSSEWHMCNLKKSIAEYSQYAQQFNPVKFNADEWAKTARDAGMKYMVITTKHHDGFALFKSEASSYNMVDATPFKRDIIRELAGACPRNGIRLGLYYSLMADWGHPGGGIGHGAPWDPAQVGSIETYFNTVAYPQVKEILSNYGPVAELWFDTDGPERPNQEQATRICNLIKATQPQIIVNKRVVPGDFINAERHIPAQAVGGDWEACDLIINGSWGYKVYRPESVRSLSSLIRQLVDVVSKGGNMLLNVGPKSDGTFPDDALDRLKGIGAWMKINGESIYGATASPFDYLPWGRCTRKGDKLYLHVFNWPADGKIKVPMSNKVTSAWLLNGKSKEALTHKTANGELTISLPGIAPDSIASVIVLQVKGEPLPVHSLALNKPVTTSDSQAQGKYAVDNNPSTAWEISKSAPSWLTIDLQSPKTFNTVRIGLGGEKVTKYSVEYRKDGAWIPVFRGENIPRDEYVKNFAPVTAQMIRFNIQEVDSQKGIRLNSFEVFDAY
ncbi:MAG: alpha-L-fucosidase [Mangrovibacterium sp.]